MNLRMLRQSKSDQGDLLGNSSPTQPQISALSFERDMTVQSGFLSNKGHTGLPENNIKESENVDSFGSVSQLNQLKVPSSGLKRSLMLNPFKAGTSGTDLASIQEKVFQASKGSKFFHHQEGKQAQWQAEIAELQRRKASISAEEWKGHLHLVKQKLSQLEQVRDLSLWIVHVDMDAFYASVEELERPQLKTVPMAVGGMSMLSTANYEARKYGVRSAMPGYIAKTLCPSLIIVPCSFEKYHKYADRVRSVYALYDPNFQSMGLDEAYLDLTEYVALDAQSRSIDEIVQEIREEIFIRTGLTASAGIACNSMLAKIASDTRKPNGQFRVDRDRDSIIRFVDPLPIRKIPGIGKVTQVYLNAFNVETCADIRQQLSLIRSLFSEKRFHFLASCSLGLADRSSCNSSSTGSIGRKSISHETTFKDSTDSAFFFQVISELAEDLEEDMKSEGLLAKIITLVAKQANFSVVNRSKSLGHFICNKVDIFEHGSFLMRQILKLHKGPLALRLLGLKLSNFVSQDQLSLGIRKYFQPSNNKIESSPSRPSPATFDCPCCGQIIPYTSQMSINDHVESCLTKTSEEKVANPFFTICDIQNDDCDKIKGKEGIKENLPLPPPFTCPICQVTWLDGSDQEVDDEPSLSNLNWINAHIDACLSSHA